MRFFRKNIWSFAYLLALLVIVVFSVRGLLRAASAAGETDAGSETVGSGFAYTIIIDPGHGGTDGGATGVTGVQESDLNLSISLKLRQVLALCGINAVMTRDSEAVMSSPDADTIAAKKITDTKNRVALINGIENALLVSIHQNMFTESRYSGAQVFYTPTEESRELAESMQSILKSALDPDNNRMAKKVSSDVYLMNNIECTGVLVECGFLSNYEEEALLRDEGYQTKVATAIAAALLVWEGGAGSE